MTRPWSLQARHAKNEHCLECGDVLWSKKHVYCSAGCRHDYLDRKRRAAEKPIITPTLADPNCPMCGKLPDGAVSYPDHGIILAVCDDCDYLYDVHGEAQ